MKRYGRMQSVRDCYDVPAYRGREIRVRMFMEPERWVRAKIMSSTGSHLFVRLRFNGQRYGPLHPTWAIDYLDGVGDRTGLPTPMDMAWQEGLDKFARTA